MKEEFDDYVCVGDIIEHEENGYRFVFRIEHDQYSSVDDFDCYSPEEREAWYSDEWFFCGVVVAAYYNCELLDNHLNSVWGIEVDLPGGNNSLYLGGISDDLLHEARIAANERRLVMIEALS